MQVAVDDKNKIQEVFTIINMNTKEEEITSIKYGLCKAISECGLSPSSAENLLLQKSGSLAAILSGINGGSDLITKPVLIGMGVGGVGGIASAILRRKVENIADNTEDSEMRKKRMQIDMYKKMVQDLKSDMSAGVA